MFRTLWTLFAVWGIGESAPQPPQPWRPVVVVPEAAAVKGIGRNDFSNEESAFNHPVASDKNIVDRGPSDVIHDLHAKYEVAVNKAERVAEEAIKFTAESLNEQGQRKSEDSLLGSPFLIRRKRETGKSGDISEEMINEMIDQMNKLNENFAQVVSHYDLKGKGKGDMAAGEDEDGDDEGKSMKGSKGRRNLSGEGSETTTEKAATTVTKEDEEEEEEEGEAEEGDSAKAERVSGDKKWRLSKKATMLHGSRVVKKAKRAKGNVKVKVSRKDDDVAEKVDPEEYEEYDEER